MAWPYEVCLRWNGKESPVGSCCTFSSDLVTVSKETFNKPSFKGQNLPYVFKSNMTCLFLLPPHNLFYPILASFSIPTLENYYSYG